MNMNELIEDSKQDTELSSDNISNKAITLSSIKCKWIERYTQERFTFKKVSAEYDLIKSQRFIFYSFDYEYTVDKKSIMDVLLPGDEKLTKKRLELDICREKIDFIEKVLSTLTSMGFDIKSFIAYEQFLAGE